MDCRISVKCRAATSCAPSRSSLKAARAASRQRPSSSAPVKSSVSSAKSCTQGSHCKRCCVHAIELKHKLSEPGLKLLCNFKVKLAIKENLLDEHLGASLASASWSAEAVMMGLAQWGGLEDSASANNRHVPFHHATFSLCAEVLAAMCKYSMKNGSL